MQKARQSALIGFLSALLFVTLSFIGPLASLGNQLYDFFLRLRPQRERTDMVVFLDVDNEAIAFNGVFPWPRSVMADGLLRLKEYDVAAVIFDIEYVDKGPQGVDAIPLEALPWDFDRTFSEIDSSMADLLNAVFDGHIDRTEVTGFFSTYIDSERQTLLDKALSIARDNDVYLARASALYGDSWATLNMRNHPLEGEQASRRTMAEELFSYPVNTTNPGKSPIEGILPPIPSFTGAAKGAGFTRAFVDSDGVRRRIDLILSYNGFWYLQLAFAPLVNYLGSPIIELEKSKLILHNAVFPDGKVKDINIPLDAGNRMLLDWPLTSFEESFEHFSFAYLSRLEQAQSEIERLIPILSFSENLYDFISRDNTLAEVPALLYRITDLLAAANEERARALAETSNEAFASYISLRNEAWALLHNFRDLDFSLRIKALGEELATRYPMEAALIINESSYLETLAENIVFSLEDFDSIEEKLKDSLKGKFCVVGQTDTGTTDIGVNPFHNEYVNVGTQGVVLDTILSESFITWLPPLWSALFCIITPVLLFLFTNLVPATRAALGFFSALLVLLFSFFLFRYAGIFLNPIYPILSLISAVVFREISAYTSSDRERQFVRKAFSTYVSDDVVEEIIANPSKLQLGGVKRHMSAIFTDIRNFSTISEQLDPEDLVRLLNRYLTAMSDIILAEKGTIDKYEGDAIVAFFGAPLELPDHALRACLSAIKIKREETMLNEIFLKQNLSPFPLITRIGINTGSMVAGNMGTDNKMNYTIMGNTVNIASRLEGANKIYETWLLTTKETLDETGERLLSRRLDKVRVVGINQPVQVYELMETREDAEEWQVETVHHFEYALALFEKREWEKAADAFRHVLIVNPLDGPSNVFIKRCENFQKNPPADDWDGVFNLGRQ